MLPLIGGTPVENIGFCDEVSEATGAIAFRHIEFVGEMPMIFRADCVFKQRLTGFR
ncbi:hypothetical protein FHS25_004331 [Rhizobium laguerreae]|uniref:Uncharacterized protein n=1 Tax=Rhizobium laguerreae TaxID=1076926 RepID=A0ABR6GC21_9HYPH|nr:hypothetical protein [Rhizobium laguerreae]MBB3163836.1 hypothetical protein [Rhizobium laguerreae]